MKFPLTTLALISANFLAYALELANGGFGSCNAYGLIPAHLEPMNFLSSLFLHDPMSFTHIVGNMACLAVFGTVVEDFLGGFVFLALYLAAGILGGAMHVLVNTSSVAPLVGASGAISGVMAVAVVLHPRLLGFVVAFIGLNVWHAFFGGGGNVSFGCHLGGFFAGAIVVLIMVIQNVVLPEDT